jgi:3-oxoacyl-[acyl-carrier protein] reductase
LRLSQLFVDAGCLVFGCSRGISAFEDRHYRHARLDIGDDAEVRRWVREIKQEAGRIDLLVCNAGIVESVLPLTLTPTAVVESYLRTNVAGTLYVCREAGKVMTRQRAGRIVAVSSTMTRLHEPGTAVYSASKGAVEEMIRVLARELASADVTCNIVAPGLISTEASDSFGAEWRERMLGLQTIKRPVTAEEIFHAVRYFASPQAAAVTGQTLYMGLVH